MNAAGQGCAVQGCAVHAVHVMTAEDNPGLAETNCICIAWYIRCASVMTRGWGDSEHDMLLAFARHCFARHRPRTQATFALHDALCILYAKIGRFGNEGAEQGLLRPALCCTC